MVYYINTERKVAKNKDVGVDINNAINFKFVKNKVEDKKEIQTKESLNKQFSKKLWNINTGIPPEEPYNTITYKNKNLNTKIVFISTWDIKCGIATYTSYLLKNIKVYNNEIADVFPVNDRNNLYKIENDIVHIQHEFGMIPQKIETDSKVLITFHTIYKNQSFIMKQYENALNVVGYIAHSKAIKDILMKSTEKDVHLIPHGSEIMEHYEKSLIRKELSFDKLGIKDDDKCAFVFGFQSGNKDFIRIIEACKNTNVKLIISGAKHECGYTNDLLFKITKKDVVILNRYLTDEEVNKFSSACDLLIFDCKSERHYSCSGAMHRVIGSGNPVICSRVNHYNDIIEHEDCLKFEGQKELELKIKKALEKNEEYSKKSLKYANRTSWGNVAKQHLKVYKRYIDMDIDKKVDDKEITDNGTVVKEIVDKETVVKETIN